jgi:hypothetical protein
MFRHSRTKRVPPKTEPKNKALEVLEESNVLKQKEELMPTETQN